MCRRSRGGAGCRPARYLENYFYERVKERRGKNGTDLLTVLCQSEDEDGNKFSDEDIVNHMIFLMMAAHDTSTSTVTTMSHYLAANPEWQDRCRDESDRLGDGPLDIEALEKLETLDLVMNESIRLVTPVQWAMRKTVRDTELLGHYLPEGTNVIAYPGMNHRLEEIYPDPTKFDPDRFAEPRNEHKKHRYAFTPFGGGAHKCIGMVFGQLEVKTIMHRLLRKYRIEAPPARIRGHVRLRRHAGTDGRHADRAAPAALRLLCASSRKVSRHAEHLAQFAFPYLTVWAQLAGVSPPSSAGSRRRSPRAAPTASGRRRVHRPLGVSTVGAADECRGVRPAGSWWNAVISTAIPCSYSIAVSAATGPDAVADDVLMRSPRASVAW